MYPGCLIALSMVRYGSFCNSSTFILGLHNLSKPLLGRELSFKKVLKTVFHHTLPSTHTGFGQNKSPHILCQNRHQDLIVHLRLVDDDKEQLAYTQVSVMEEQPLLYIFVCILRDLPKQKIPRELCGGGDPTIFLRSHGKIFQGDGSGKFKKQEGKNGGKKKKRFLQLGGFHTCVFSIDLECPTSLSRTHSYGNLPYKIISLRYKNVGCEL